MPMFTGLYFPKGLLLILCFLATIEAKALPHRERHKKFLEPKKKDRRPSSPFITGDGFRNHCDFILDEEIDSLTPETVKQGDKIFVKTDLISLFFQEHHPKIAAKYILVTHNSDFPIPGPFSEYLEDEKILAWFGQNIENAVHPKLHPLPIGLENRYNTNGNPDVVKQSIDAFRNREKKTILYMNFTVNTSPTERGKVYDIFSGKQFCKICFRIPYVKYLQDLAETQFILSPRGNGLDCHRTWEALYLGAIPIVRTSANDALYKDLPVVIIQDWHQVTEDFLKKKWGEIQGSHYALDRLNIDYWLQQIDSAGAPIFP